MTEFSLSCKQKLSILVVNFSIASTRAAFGTTVSSCEVFTFEGGAEFLVGEPGEDFLFKPFSVETSILQRELRNGCLPVPPSLKISDGPGWQSCRDQGANSEADK
ncbi:hypothetical protein UPYG_G00080900 [Umbra pygmaea]|uniref:Uncharacterized protein n=1 Tax=Umbra pygmaea TaxID=75934 RepID=A0ABD0XVA9_UMBPY